MGLLKMKTVGPSMRAADAPVKQALRLEFAPALETLEMGGQGLQLGLPEGMKPTRFRSLIQAVSNKAGYTVYTEVAYRTDKRGEPVLVDGEKVVVGVNVYKAGLKEPAVEDVPPPVPENPKKGKRLPEPEDEEETEDPLADDDDDDDDDDGDDDGDD